MGRGNIPRVGVETRTGTTAITRDPHPKRFQVTLGSESGVGDQYSRSPRQGGSDRVVGVPAEDRVWIPGLVPHLTPVYLVSGDPTLTNRRNKASADDMRKTP